MNIADHSFIFVGGLHRSGTSLFAKCLSDHPAISGFENTGAIEDEGQHLQSVFPRAMDYGGPGGFGFAKAMHLTEVSMLATEANQERLWSEWSRYWDLNLRHLLEKSPPNLTKSRFLQALFPNTRFIFLLRHPVAVASATKKWAQHTPLDRLIEHWAVCHEILGEDLPHLEHARVILYRDFVREPERILEDTFRFIGLGHIQVKREFRSDVNNAYFENWAKWREEFFAGWSIRKAERRLEARVNELGYSVVDPRLEMPSPWPLVSG